MLHEDLERAADVFSAVADAAARAVEDEEVGDLDSFAAVIGAAADAALGTDADDMMDTAKAANSLASAIRGASLDLKEWGLASDRIRTILDSTPGAPPRGGHIADRIRDTIALLRRTADHHHGTVERIAEALAARGWGEESDRDHRSIIASINALADDRDRRRVGASYPDLIIASKSGRDSYASGVALSASPFPPESAGWLVWTLAYREAEASDDHGAASQEAARLRDELSEQAAVATELRAKLQRAEESAGAKLDPSTIAACIRRADGCNDYMGGYHDAHELEIFRHGIGTVVNALTALRDNPSALQGKVLDAVGARRSEPSIGDAIRACIDAGYDVRPREVRS